MQACIRVGNQNDVRKEFRLPIGAEFFLLKRAVVVRLFIACSVND